MDGFVFYRSFYDAMQFVDNDTKATLLDTICKYVFEGEVTDLDGVAGAMWTLIKPQIDANIKRREDGAKGAAYGKLGGRPKKNPGGDINENPSGDISETPKVKVKEKVKEKVKVKEKGGVGEKENGEQTDSNVTDSPRSRTDDRQTIISEYQNNKLLALGAEQSLIDYCVARMGEQRGVRNPTAYLEQMVREHVEHGRTSAEEADAYYYGGKTYNKTSSQDDYPIYEPRDWGI